MAKLTEAEMIVKYDAERSGAIYVKDEPLTDDEERALDILLKRDEPEDTDSIIAILEGGEQDYQQQLASVARQIGTILCAEEQADYTARFAAGFQAGQAIGQKLIADAALGADEDIDELI